MKSLKYIIIFFFLFPQVLNAQEYIINSVPFFPSEDFQCGPSSLATVLNFLGMEITPDEIAKDIYSKGARGTSDFDMIIFAQKRGFKAVQYTGSIEDIKEKIQADKPLIVMTDEGYWFYRKYHFMVVVGFSDDFVIVNSGTEMNKKIKIHDFLKKWRKTDFWTLLITR
ncbi:MAG TPA: C39 family peptidase [Thermodesulfovibrio thiophilus]|uniref:C39 family peptidase n=1 Tax=Thermodesulfovibrio thiophilus TaxID=340095 RepID=UPI0004260509|nr:C39 family peptidase [Thermodesulfovibrio thiophilus]HOA83708.1 C39 family peptidase [Thermodesulfovibrio thiophilus]HQA03862.1 C39 family peptidase [Thermodesulfovibrio thiophilus]HQD36405.1 C39 family peptidase [Thermodesulfovibrio thiophilus]